MNQLADLKTQLDAKLEYVMRNHTNVLARVEVKAPLIIIASRGDVHGHKDDLVLIDLGHIALTTEKLAKLAAAESLLHDMDDEAPFTIYHAEMYYFC